MTSSSSAFSHSFAEQVDTDGTGPLHAQMPAADWKYNPRLRRETQLPGSRVMASVDIGSPHRVGKYGVDVSAVDAIAEATLAPRRAEVFLVDEIGKMECFSIVFVEAARRLLAANRLIVASVAFKGGGLIEEVKRLPGVVLREVTARNRDRLPSEVIQWVNEQLVHSDAERS